MPGASTPAHEQDFWRDRRVLVTGGCGFIGSHLVDALLAAGCEVVVLDAYNSFSSRGLLENLEHPRLEVELGDVADSFFVRELSAGVDTIFHLAALIGIPYSYKAPGHYVRTNVEGTLAVLESARAEGIRRLVHTSTAETYGSARFEPMDESHPLVAQSPYAATKIAADQLAESYFRSFDVPVVTLRPFNTFGPRQSLRAVVPTLMSQALTCETIAIGSLTPVRDMNYVGDTVSAFLGVGSTPGIEGELFNVGSGVGRTVAEIADAVQRVAGTSKPIAQIDARRRPELSEVKALICDYGKAKATFGYEPRVEFEEGLVRVRDYLVSRASQARVSDYHV
jgi:nucleoside-diphosphate-sugar epimerase